MARAKAAAASPFKPAASVEPRVKALVYGPSGVGKTFLALSAPGRIAVIDTEGGTAYYADRGLSDYDVISTKAYSDVIEAVDFVERNPGIYSSLVIDPISVIYDTLQEAAHKARVVKAMAKAERMNAAEDFDPGNVDLEMLDWGRIKRLYKALMTRLVNLPCHVVVTARQKDVTERKGSELVKVGVGPEAEKSTPYAFDVVLRMTFDGGKRVAIVEKDRTGLLDTGSTIPDPSFGSLFTRLVEPARPGKAGATRQVPDDDGAAAKDTGAFGESVATPAQVADLVAALVAAGYDPEDVRARRNLPPFGEMPADKVIGMTDWAVAKAAEIGGKQ